MFKLVHKDLLFCQNEATLQIDAFGIWDSPADQAPEAAEAQAPGQHCTSAAVRRFLESKNLWCFTSQSGFHHLPSWSTSQCLPIQAPPKVALMMFNDSSYGFQTAGCLGGYGVLKRDTFGVSFPYQHV